jgi:hypothetical protein
VWAVILLAASATAAHADTLRSVLQAEGVAHPSTLPDLDRSVGHVILTRDGPTTFVVYDAGGPSDPVRLVALRLGPKRDRFTRAPLTWPRSAPAGLDAQTCRRLDSARAYPRAVLVTAHLNPSASCTLVLGRDLTLRAVLPGWPIAGLPDGRIVYQKSQVHFAAVHPMELVLFDPNRLADVPLYPRPPHQAVRAAHVARMRQAYTDAWCAPRNHPCDPELFDESLASEVVVSPRGDALAFVVALDNTGGWPDTERWGRLEPFRELRATLAAWNGHGAPPDTLPRALVAGLSRARNLSAGPLIAVALAGDPELRDLVGAVLASPIPEGVDAARWPAMLDPRWSDPSTWNRLARAIEVPDEVTEVVYVYVGLRPPGPLRYRELLRRDVEARFGQASLTALTEPAMLRQIFGPPSDSGSTAPRPRKGS